MDRILLIIYPEKELRFFAYPIWICYFLGRMMLGLIFLGRLFFTFRGSSLEYSKCTMRSLYFMWGLMPIFAVLSTVIIAIDPDGLLMIGIVFGTLFILIDIVLSIILLFLYLKKLFDLTSTEHNNNTKLINLMTRYCLLYCTCFITTFVVFILLALAPVNSSTGSYRYQGYIWCVVAADSMFNILCLWLNFAFAKVWYFRICGYCHDKCESCCTKKHKELNDDNGKSIEIQTLKDQSSFDDEEDETDQNEQNNIIINDDDASIESGYVKTKN